MQYDLNKIGGSALVKVTWHGAPTRVLVHGEGEKRDVGTGESIEVTVQQAKELLNISRDFTLEGDVPMKQARPKVEKEVTDEEGNKVVVMTVELAEKLDKKKDVMEALKELNVAFNDALSKNDLKMLLVEALKEKEANDAKGSDDGAGNDKSPEGSDDKKAPVAPEVK